MAEQQQMESFDEVTEELERQKAAKREKQKQEALKREKAEKEKRFSEGLERLAERVLLAEQSGDMNTYFLLKTFLDLALEIQDLMENLKSIGEAMECLTAAIGFIDDSLDLDQMMGEQSLQHRYGFFSRLKQKIRNKKIIRNNAARIQMLVDNIAMKAEMATSMTQSMATLGVKIRSKMSKVSEKSKKRADKKGLGDAMGATSAKGDAYLAKIRAQKNAAEGGEGAGAPASGGNYGGAPAGGNASGNGSGNYDDVL